MRRNGNCLRNQRRLNGPRSQNNNEQTGDLLKETGLKGDRSPDLRGKRIRGGPGAAGTPPSEFDVAVETPSDRRYNFP
jgi:hypothetical protein